MNADFEMELAAPSGRYYRTDVFEQVNRRLSEYLLYLTAPNDAVLIEEPYSNDLLAEAAKRNVSLISPGSNPNCSDKIFAPWGWTASAIEVGKSIGAKIPSISLDVIKKVNSKLFSHALEVELGVALSGSATVSTFEELAAAVATGAPNQESKWVIKGPLGFAARDRILGRGPIMPEPQAKWCRKRLSSGETLIFQPWLDVIREYGVQMIIGDDGAIDILGISDLQTNGAGASTGYILGRIPENNRIEQLTETALFVGRRLFEEGYMGPAGMDALEHSGGLHPLLEINARYTMGFVAVAKERELNPSSPVFWPSK
jgi:hypothetical protein